MKAYTWLIIAMIVFIVVFGVRASLAQASPERESTNGIKPITEWRTETIEQVGDVGSYAAIAFDPGSGTPWISYYDADDTALKVAHYKGSGGNCGPASEWYCETVDNTAAVGKYSSIDVYPNIETFPLNSRKIGVAYYDSQHGALKFAEYSCFMTNCEWSIVFVTEPSIAYTYNGQGASVKYNEVGKPLIAFFTFIEGAGEDAYDELNYAYQVPSLGTCGWDTASGKWNCYNIEKADGVGQFPSLDYSTYGVDIAYYDDDGYLKYAHLIGPGIGNCGTDNRFLCIYVDGLAGNNVGKFASIHAPDNSADVVRFAYYEAANGWLKYAKYVPGDVGNCGFWGGSEGDFQCDYIETIGTGISQAGISLGMDGNGFPIIAYMDDANSSGGPVLKVARPTGALGGVYGNCGDEFSPDWRCTTIDSGGSLQKEAEYASIAIDPDGLATIAYSEWVSLLGHTGYNLKIANLREILSLPIVRK